MKRLSALLPFMLVLASFFIAPYVPHVSAASEEALQEETARRALRLSGEEKPDAARVRTVEDWLARASRNTGETPETVLAACVRNVRYLFDAGKVPATPVELLEALNAYSTKNEILNNLLHRYDAARLAAPDKSHGAAMRALGEKRGPAVW